MIDTCAGDHHVVSVYQSGHCDCGAWTWEVERDLPAVSSTGNPTTEGKTDGE